MKKNLPKLMFALGSVLALNSLAPTSAMAIDLVPTVKDAILHSPEFRKAVKENQGVKADLTAAEGDWLPTVNLGAGFGREEIDTDANSRSLDRQETSIRASQNLFKGFGTQNEIKRQQARLESANLTTQAAANKVALDMVDAYYTQLREQRLYMLALDNRQTHERILDQIIQRSQAGVGNEVEVDQAKARLALANSNVSASKNNYQDVMTRFHRVLGRFPDSELSTPAITLTLPDSVDDAVDVALVTHPSLRAANSDITDARMEYDVVRQAFYPTVSIEVQKTYDDNINGIEGKNENFQAMLRMRYNLFNGGKDSARLDRAASEIYQAAEVRNNTRRDVIESLRYAWKAKEFIEEQMLFQQQQIDMTLQTLEGYREQFSLGRRTLLDLLNTEDEYIRAQMALINSETDFKISQYRILAATGQLIDTLGIQLDYDKLIPQEGGE